ncbi:unnamed protein product, partial [Durusdinium trenchii]
VQPCYETPDDKDATQVVKVPDPYTFNESVGLDIVTVKHNMGDPYQILHVMRLGSLWEDVDGMGWPTSVRDQQPWHLHERVGEERMQVQAGRIGGATSTGQGRTRRWCSERNAPKGDQRYEHDRRVGDADGFGGMPGEDGKMMK